ncbi:MAG: dihydropteroate synthase [Proteobacteria bacterium]|nr:dihydropteroate synthase [Pseudomonadota bacterium]
MKFENLSIIGERINPGFKSTEALFENKNIEGIQALAVKQAEAGAVYLNINCGRHSTDDPDFLREVIRSVQKVVDIPLSFDFPSVEVQEVCLSTYDIDEAKGRKPIVNSIAETRWEMLELAKIRPFKLILMASERMEEGRGKPNKHADEVYDTTCRMINSVMNSGQDFSMDDLIVDVSVSALAADTEGLTNMAIEAIDRIGSDPELKGVHIMGGLSNIGQLMPAKAADGTSLKIQLENSFLTLANPLGFDFLLGTPWRDYHPLPDDNYVFKTFKEILDLSGMDALRAILKLYKKE